MSEAIFSNCIFRRAVTGSLLVAFAVGSSLALASEQVDPEAGPGYRKGLAWVLFDDPAFRHPVARGIDACINMDAGATKAVYSQLWSGYIVGLSSGPVTFTAEADDGLRLTIGGQVVIDGLSQASRTASLPLVAGQLYPITVAFFQNGGSAHLRLFWQREGEPRQLIPPQAFWHTEQDVDHATDLLGLTYATSKIFSASEPSNAVDAIPIHPGPHLFLDNFLIAESRNVLRRVNVPRRESSIPNPVITGPEDRNFQPYLTVVRDERTGRFRVWFDARPENRDPNGQLQLGYLESADGINWQRPTRVQNDPGSLGTGVSVIDEGTQFHDPATRFKFAYYGGAGLSVAVSPDGINWQLAADNVLRHSRDINSLFWDRIRQRYVATVSQQATGHTWSGSRRTAWQAYSTDLKNWSPLLPVLVPDDLLEDGQTEFYGMDGFLIRGDLIIGMVKVLRDDLSADDAPQSLDLTDLGQTTVVWKRDDPAGIGHTTLAWSRDGQTWYRDTEKFFDRNPAPGTWDHAHAWVDEQLAVGDQVFLYYGGYKSGHKANRFDERQIGLMRMRRDRYVARRAGADGGTLTTPLLTLEGDRLTINANASSGEISVEVLDKQNQPIPGFTTRDFRAIHSDDLDAPAVWSQPLANLKSVPIRLRFHLTNAELFAIDVIGTPSTRTPAVTRAAAPAPLSVPTTESSRPPISLRPPPPPPWPAGHRITGYVYRDLDTSVCCAGVRDANEPGLEGQQVVVTSPDQRMTFGSMLTDSSGRYDFSNLAPGFYRVSIVIPAGYVRTTDDSTVMYLVEDDAYQRRDDLPEYRLKRIDFGLFAR